MPRYLSIARRDEQNRPTEAPSPDLQQRMSELYEEITKAGVVLDMAELTPTSEVRAQHFYREILLGRATHSVNVRAGLA